MNKSTIFAYTFAIVVSIAGAMYYGFVINPEVERQRIVEVVRSEFPVVDSKYPVHDVYVVDGDTIRADVELPFDVVLNDQKIRFLGVDTPERPSKAEWTAARNFVVNMIDGKTVWITPNADAQRDSFGRILARVYVRDGEEFIDLAEELIDKGLGVPYDGK